MLLAISVALIMLATAVFLLGVLGYWTAATLQRMKTFLAHLGTRVTSLLRSIGTRVTARRQSLSDIPCDCLACHHFAGVELPTAVKHKLLPRLAERVAEDMAVEIEEFLSEAERA